MTAAAACASASRSPRWPARCQLSRSCCGVGGGRGAPSLFATAVAAAISSPRCGCESTPLVSSTPAAVIAGLTYTVSFGGGGVGDGDEVAWVPPDEDCSAATSLATVDASGAAQWCGRPPPRRRCDCAIASLVSEATFHSIRSSTAESPHLCLQAPRRRADHQPRAPTDAWRQAAYSTLTTRAKWVNRPRPTAGGRRRRADGDRGVALFSAVRRVSASASGTRARRSSPRRSAHAQRQTVLGPPQLLALAEDAYGVSRGRRARAASRVVWVPRAEWTVDGCARAVPQSIPPLPEADGASVRVVPFAERGTAEPALCHGFWDQPLLPVSGLQLAEAARVLFSGRARARR